MGSQTEVRVAKRKVGIEKKHGDKWLEEQMEGDGDGWVVVATGGG